MHNTGPKPVTYDEMIIFYEGEFQDKTEDFLRGYIRAIDDKPVSKALNALFMRDNGARYAAAHRTLEKLTKPVEV